MGGKREGENSTIIRGVLTNLLVYYGEQLSLSVLPHWLNGMGTQIRTTLDPNFQEELDQSPLAPDDISRAVAMFVEERVEVGINARFLRMSL